MRVFLDTNIWISAFTASGLCEELLSACLERHEVLTSRLVWQEIEGVLGRKLSPAPETRKLIEELWNAAESVPDLPPAAGDNDMRLLHAAAAAGARYFVTGDRELLDRGKLGETAIVSPRTCWEALFTGG